MSTRNTHFFIIPITQLLKASCDMQTHKVFLHQRLFMHVPWMSWAIRFRIKDTLMVRIIRRVCKKKSFKISVGPCAITHLAHLAISLKKAASFPSFVIGSSTRSNCLVYKCIIFNLPVTIYFQGILQHSWVKVKISQIILRWEVHNCDAGIDFILILIK